jgi:hypothetical protein
MTLLALAAVVLAILVYVGRRGRPVRFGLRPSGGARPTPAEARAILGVGADAGRDEVEAAYRRLMLRAHPDQGGTTGLAAQLNAARACLIKKS